jgi:hypothetical protein
MHELSLAGAVVDTVERHAAGRRVLVIQLRLGELRQVVPDSLAFCEHVARHACEARRWSRTVARSAAGDRMSWELAHSGGLASTAARRRSGVEIEAATIRGQPIEEEPACRAVRVVRTRSTPTARSRTLRRFDR